MTVSVVIAAHNEAPSIAGVVEGCRAHTPDLAEVLVVDDGSTDDTAKRAENAGARVVRMGVNQGKGAALRRGIREARGDVVVFIDGDGQDDPREVTTLLDALGPDVAMVVGSRFLGRFHRGAITPVNKRGNVALTAALNALFGTRFTDSQAGFRAARRSALTALDLRARAYDIETEVLIQVHRAGGRVVEVPVDRSARTHGESGLSSVRDGSRILARMLRLRLGLYRASGSEVRREGSPSK